MTAWCCVCLEEMVTTHKIQPLDCNLKEFNAPHAMKHCLITSATSYSNIYYHISQVGCFVRVSLPCFLNIYVLLKFAKCLFSCD
jgi:hypothetical protein